MRSKPSNCESSRSYGVPVEVQGQCVSYAYGTVETYLERGRNSVTKLELAIASLATIDVQELDERVALGLRLIDNEVGAIHDEWKSARLG